MTVNPADGDTLTVWIVTHPAGQVYAPYRTLAAAEAGVERARETFGVDGLEIEEWDVLP